MKYKLHRVSDDTFELRAPDGTVINTYSPPIENVQEVMVPDILDHIGVRGAVKSALLFLMVGGIEEVDDR